MKKIFLVVAIAIMISIILYSAFAFATWEMNPKYWGTEWRTFCAFLMGTITFADFLYFIIELSNK